ncbi:restriction endonuclease [Novosphingobium sp.]|uniref:restriction endonuclease n=1 Tax=Novosphingobium sp. TaxID=1874826 RepID=UPI0035B3492C
MAALEKFEATEANLVKLERLWKELEELTPTSIQFGGSDEHEDRARSYAEILRALPAIDGWRPDTQPMTLDEVAQNRLDAMELGEPHISASVEAELAKPGRELREYRFRLNQKRRALIRDALVSLIDTIDEDVRGLKAFAESSEPLAPPPTEDWAVLLGHVREIEVLLGSSVPKPPRWGDMLRHIKFAELGDLDDIDTMDWPSVKKGLRKDLYGENEPLPVEVDDLGVLVAARPGGSVTTELAWSNLNDDGFERLIFSLISNELGYENPEWLMRTRAADRGRDLSVTRVTVDGLSGTRRQRVVIQCKHWLSKSVTLTDASGARDQMALWPNPPVDVLIITTSGRFTSDAVAWIEQHNQTGIRPNIEMWPESHLERVLASRPALIAEAKLR